MKALQQDLANMNEEMKAQQADIAQAQQAYNEAVEQLNEKKAKLQQAQAALENSSSEPSKRNSSE